MKRLLLIITIVFLCCGIAALSVLLIRPYLVRSTESLKISRNIPNQADGKIVLIGINGLDGDIIQRFSAEGHLQVLPQLVSEGSYGQVSTLFNEDEDSIWTTISTGYLPEHHGIRQSRSSVTTKGIESGESVWKNGQSRKRWAFWEITAHLKKEVLVVGWPVSWPADSVKGVLITDRVYLFNPDRFIPETHGLCYPSSLLTRILPVIRSCQESYTGVFDATFSGNSDTISTFLSLTWKNSLKPVPHAELSRTSPLDPIRKSFYKDYLTYELFRWSIHEFGQKPVVACYFENVDRISHMFGITAGKRPSSFTSSSARKSWEAGHEVLLNYYRYMDRLVGLIIAGLEPQTTVFIVSGHGFNIQTGDHADCPAGWFVLHGSGIRRKNSIDGVTLSDIAPTLMYLAGLPVPDNADGEIIYEAFTLSELEKHKVLHWADTGVPALQLTRNINSQGIQFQ